MAAQIESMAGRLKGWAATQSVRSISSDGSWWWVVASIRQLARPWRYVGWWQEANSSWALILTEQERHISQQGGGGGCIFSARPTTHSVRHGQQQKNGWNQSINDTGRAYNEAGKEPAPSIVATNSSRIRAKMIATKGSISCHLFSLSLDSLMLFMYRLVLYPSHRFGRNTSITASNLSTNPHNGYFNLST